MAGLVAFALVGVSLWRLADHDLDRRISERFEFNVEGARMSGTIWMPDAAPNAAIVFAHGDGAQDRTSSGGYAPIINSLLDRGIAVASWDKPGVGSSEGNWLHQSMTDRTTETQAALEALEQRFKGVRIGALGFSQAGWVLPTLTREDADFLVLLGPAVSWRDQGDYFARTRLAGEGLDTAAINEIVARQNLEDDRTFGTNAQASDAPPNMSPDRWGFIRRNRTADAQQALSTLDLPVLAIWGADDLNVDARQSAQIYRDALAGRHAATQIIVWPEATHGLLKTHAYNWQLTQDWTPLAIMRFLAEGRYAYAPGALEEISSWILERSKDQ